MAKVRVVRTASTARAVQVVYYKNNKRVILKHIGSAQTDEAFAELLLQANEWIKSYEGQLSIFPDANPNNILFLNQCEFLGVYYTFLYDVLVKLQEQIGFTAINQKLLVDLVVIRLLEPASKLRSIELLETYFGIKHSRNKYYQSALKWIDLKAQAESKALLFAQQEYGFEYDLLFYDVTTLYFETFEDDDLRKQGFSKDSKSQQPQILVALMVTKEGFPMAYDVFPGNTFEGHTILPFVKDFIEKNKVANFTIIADAAMISNANIEELTKAKIHYIVAARLGNLSKELLNEIDASIHKADGNTIRLKTDKGFLVCSYSTKRYRKDKYEMEKQIEKAKQLIDKPSKSKRLKFTKSKGEELFFNQALVDKTNKLLGIKGYYTDLEEQTISNQIVIERYHELYRIEQAFRISKSDLQTRPVFHFKEEPIKLHLLICFVALTVAKHIELKTQVSIRRFITDCKKITDARMINKVTNKEIRMRRNYDSKILEYLTKLKITH